MLGLYVNPRPPFIQAWQSGGVFSDQGLLEPNLRHEAFSCGGVSPRL